MSGDSHPFSAAPPLDELVVVDERDLLRLADDEAEVQTGEQIELSLAAMAVIEL